MAVGSDKPTISNRGWILSARLRVGMALDDSELLHAHRVANCCGKKILFLLLYCEFCSLAVSHFSVAFEMMFCLVLPPDSMKILAKNAEHCYRHKRCLCSLLSPNPCHPIHFLSTGTRCFFFTCHILFLLDFFTMSFFACLTLFYVNLLERLASVVHKNVIQGSSFFYVCG